MLAELELAAAPVFSSFLVLVSVICTLFTISEGRFCKATFPSLSKKPVKAIESVKGYANIATIAAPLAAPKPVAKPVAKLVAKTVEQEYETDDDDDDDDNDSVYSSKIPDDDKW